MVIWNCIFLVLLRLKRCSSFSFPFSLLRYQSKLWWFYESSSQFFRDFFLFASNFVCIRIWIVCFHCEILQLVRLMQSLHLCHNLLFILLSSWWNFVLLRYFFGKRSSLAILLVPASIVIIVFVEILEKIMRLNSSFVYFSLTYSSGKKFLEFLLSFIHFLLAYCRERGDRGDGRR